MFNIILPPPTYPVYYLSVPDRYHNYAGPIAEKYHLQKITFQIGSLRGNSVKSFSGWMSPVVEKVLLFREEIKLSISLAEIHYFLFDGLKVHPCYMDFKVKDQKEKDRIAKRLKKLKSP